jgi:hypothetical protein
MKGQEWDFDIDTRKEILRIRQKEMEKSKKKLNDLEIRFFVILFSAVVICVILLFIAIFFI